MQISKTFQTFFTFTVSLTRGVEDRYVLEIDELTMDKAYKQALLFGVAQALEVLIALEIA